MSEEQYTLPAGAAAARPAAFERRELLVMLLARLALNIPTRFIYPFLPAISRGLGVPLTEASLLLTARSLTTAASPLLGLAADRYGRRSLMLVGLAILAASGVVVALAPHFAWALVAFALLGLAKAAFDPAMQAHVSDTVPYARRGRVLSILELSWSLSWLVGVPAVGFLIAGAGWQAPFLAVALLALLSLAAVAAGLRPDPGSATEHPVPQAGARDGRPRAGLAAAGGEFARLLAAARRLGAVVWLALLVNLLQLLALENVFVVYGSWLEDRFGLSVAALGLASTVIAVAEFAAESGAATLVDRIGKRRAVAGGILLSTVAYLWLPHAAGGLAGALAGMCLLFLAFEFAVVAVLPLVSELAPGARATVMALNVAAMSVGRVIASLTGPRLWAAGGLALNTGVSAAVALAAALILILAVKEAPIAE